jgi:hypothetical protein
MPTTPAPPNTPALSPSNVLYYGDNLDILRRYIDDESVDLTYLDTALDSGVRVDRTGILRTIRECRGVT